MVHTKKGIAIPSIVLGRIGDHWENADKFDPSRFSKEGKSIAAHLYPNFNLPPRLCLGKHVALMEAKIALARLLLKYKLVLVDESVHQRYKVGTIFGPTLQMKNGIWVYLVPQ